MSIEEKKEEASAKQSGLERVLEQVELAECVFADSLKVDPSSIDIARRTASVIRGESSSLSCVDCSLTKLSIALSLDLTPDLTAEVSIPCEQQSSDQHLSASVFIRCHRSGVYNTQSLSDFREQCRKQEWPSLFELLDWLSEKSSSISETETKSKLKSKTVDFSAMKLRRSYLWSHHIYSSKKKEIIKKQAKINQISGFVVTGKPGVIIAEGLSSDVKAFATHLKSLTWKRLIERHIEEEEWDSSHRKFPEGFAFYDYKSGMKGGMRKVSDLMSEVGLDKQFGYLADVHCDIEMSSEDSTQDMPPWMEEEEKGVAQSDDGCRVIVIHCRVTCNCRSSQIHATQSQLSIQVKAKPKDGEANAEILGLLKQRIPVLTDVSIVKGLKSRNKSVRLTGVSSDDVQRCLMK